MPRKKLCFNNNNNNAKISEYAKVSDVTVTEVIVPSTASQMQQTAA
jgi:hypothetical protein